MVAFERDNPRLGELIDVIATLRDTLLPKLLSGELSVAGAAATLYHR
jgi:hypothetical protein